MAASDNRIGAGRRVFLVVVPGWLPGHFTSEKYGVDMKDTASTLLGKEGFAVDPEILFSGGDIETRAEAFFNIPNLDQRFNADAIIFFAHSQGVPVTHIIRQRMFLSQQYSQMLERKIIGAICLAGVTSGTSDDLARSTFAWLILPRQTYQLGTLANLASSISLSVVDAKKHCIERECRDVYVHAFNDTVVPFRSSVELLDFNPRLHMRAVFAPRVQDSLNDPVLRLQLIHATATNHGFEFCKFFADSLEEAVPLSAGVLHWVWCYGRRWLGIGADPLLDGDSLYAHGAVLSSCDEISAGIRFIFAGNSDLLLHGKKAPVKPFVYYSSYAHFLRLQIEGLSTVEDVFILPQNTQLGEEVRKMVELLEGNPNDISERFGSERWERMRRRWERRALLCDMVDMLRPT